ncbi:acyl-CoA dehydrogenase family protein, partial [candidate division KSB1 bacterium]|nr:acyl-CoA dehydrogenase family protein [candidate division KSB1 bacterium]
MKEYDGVEKETNTPDSANWKKKVWDKLTLKVVDDYLFSNDIQPKDDSEVKAAFEQHKKVLEELGYYGAPDTGTRTFGVGMIGPTLIIHGNDAQKSQYLPKITSGEHIWCQGY